MACFLYGSGGGDKVVSGTFSGNSSDSKTISVSEITTAKYVMVTARLSAVSASDTAFSVVFDFSNNYGFAAARTSAANIIPLADSANSDYRPTLSGGTLTLKCGILGIGAKFASGVTYEWALIGT